MFVELKRKEYWRGCYHSEPSLFALSDISRVISCVDDHSCTNLVTKDGKVHTIAERYENVFNKIREAMTER